jgi:hypothetical protein
LILSACGSNDAQDFSVESTLEAGITNLMGTADEAGNQDFVAQSTLTLPVENLLDWISNPLRVPEAWAIGSCTGRSFKSSCVDGKREAVYSDCRIAKTPYTLKGLVSLAYNTAAIADGCELDDTNDALTRTTDITRTGSFGGTTRTTSENRTTWDGAIVSGGATLLKTDTGFSLSQAGFHRIRVGSRGKTIYDLTIQTINPLQISGSLSRSTRTITSGSARVFHNLPKFTTTFSVANLTFSADCCYPKGGTITATRTGSNEVSTATFTACGQGTVQIGPLVKDFVYADTCE